MKRCRNNLKYGYLAAIIILCVSACSTTGSNKVSKEQNQTAANYNVQLGVGYLQQGEVARAKQKLLLALKQAPNWSPALNAMAYFLETTGEVSQAEHYYKRALAVDPRSGSTLNNYGAFLCKQKNYEEAEKYFMLAVQDPNYMKAAEAYENAGLCALKARHYAKAERFFGKALLQDPHSLTSLLELADINYMKSHYSESYNYLQTYYKYAEPNAQSEGLRQRLATKLGYKGQQL